MSRPIDISVVLEGGIRSDPPGLEPSITYYDHRQTLGQLLPFLPGLQASDLPDGEAWAIEQLALTTHVLMNTAAGSRYGAEDYIDRGCGCGREGTLWLLERGVRVTGPDGWSWDAPSRSPPGVIGRRVMHG